MKTYRIYELEKSKKKCFVFGGWNYCNGLASLTGEFVSKLGDEISFNDCINVGNLSEEVPTFSYDSAMELIKAFLSKDIPLLPAPHRISSSYYKEGLRRLINDGEITGKEFDLVLSELVSNCYPREIEMDIDESIKYHTDSENFSIRYMYKLNKLNDIVKGGVNNLKLDFCLSEFIVPLHKMINDDCLAISKEKHIHLSSYPHRLKFDLVIGVDKSLTLSCNGVTKKFVKPELRDLFEFFVKGKRND